VIVNPADRLMDFAIAVEKEIKDVVAPSIQCHLNRVDTILDVQAWVSLCTIAKHAKLNGRPKAASCQK
jgi:hypothetical protein